MGPEAAKRRAGMMVILDTFWSRRDTRAGLRLSRAEEGGMDIVPIPDSL